MMVIQLWNTTRQVMVSTPQLRLLLRRHHRRRGPHVDGWPIGQYAGSGGATGAGQINVCMVIGKVMVMTRHWKQRRRRRVGMTRRGKNGRHGGRIWYGEGEIGIIDVAAGRIPIPSSRRVRGTGTDTSRLAVAWKRREIRLRVAVQRECRVRRHEPAVRRERYGFLRGNGCVKLRPRLFGVHDDGGRARWPRGEIARIPDGGDGAGCGCEVMHHSGNGYYGGMLLEAY